MTSDPLFSARTLKLTISYDGTRFVGWQRQREGESIQGLIEEALARLEGGPVSVHGAGRTDAGVHALGQVASVRLACRHDTATLARALNAQLPEDIRVLAVDEVSADFHARFSARSKTYRYQIRNAPIAGPFERAYVWHVKEPLAIAPMQDAASRLVGTHDFAAFRSAGGDTATTVRTMTASAVDERNGFLTYEISGDGFLRHMVRAIVGTLVEVGRGWREPHDMACLLQGGTGGPEGPPRRLTRAQAGPTAPPHGLLLVRVDYD